MISYFCILIYLGICVTIVIEIWKQTVLTFNISVYENTWKRVRMGEWQGRERVRTGYTMHQLTLMNAVIMGCKDRLRRNKQNKRRKKHLEAKLAKDTKAYALKTAKSCWQIHHVCALEGSLGYQLFSNWSIDSVHEIYRYFDKIILKSIKMQRNENNPNYFEVKWDDFTTWFPESLESCRNQSSSEGGGNRAQDQTSCLWSFVFYGVRRRRMCLGRSASLIPCTNIQ